MRPWLRAYLSAKFVGYCEEMQTAESNFVLNYLISYVVNSLHHLQLVQNLKVILTPLSQRNWELLSLTYGNINEQLYFFHPLTVFLKLLISRSYRAMYISCTTQHTNKWHITKDDHAVIEPMLLSSRKPLSNSICSVCRN